MLFQQDFLFSAGNLLYWEMLWLSLVHSLESGNLEIHESGIQNIPKMTIISIKIRSAQNVCRVLISKKKTPDPFEGHF